jgi:hypothetical protein
VDRLDRFFEITARKSMVAAEVRGGGVTFIAMAYIIVLNPIILSSAPDVTGHKLEFTQVSAMTSLAAGVMTLLFGVIARLPFAFAAGLGINSFLVLDGLVLTQPWPSTSSEKARGMPDRVIHYQYRHHRARRALRGIDEQVAKAQRAVDGHTPVKRNRYIQLCGATKSVNRTLEAKTRAQAGWKGYTTNLTTESAQFVIDA